MTRGDKLKQLRKKKGLTQAQVLEELAKQNKQIDKNTLSGAENNKNISNTTMEILAQYYNVTFDYLKIDEIDNTTNENIEINKILGLSDKSIEKIKNTKGKMYRNTSSLNTWIENFEDFNSFIMLLDYYYYLVDRLKDVQYFIWIDELEDVFTKMKKTELTSICDLLKEKNDYINYQYDIELEKYIIELYDLIEKIRNKKDIKKTCSNISNIGLIYFSFLKEKIKTIKLELLESFLKTVPIKYESIFEEYYEEDKPLEYIELKKKVK